MMASVVLKSLEKIRKEEALKKRSNVPEAAPPSPILKIRIRELLLDIKA